MSNILRIPPRRMLSVTSKMELDMPQIMTINQVAAPSSEPDFEEEYVTDEEEVDEIIDDEPPPAATKLNGKGKAKATPSNLTPSVTPAPVDQSQTKPKVEVELPPLPPRKPGETYVDQQRVEKIIKAHGDMLPPSKDAVFLISLAVDEFVKRLTESGRRRAAIEKRSSIDQRDLALATESERGYSFLRETVPLSMPLSMALRKHAQKENERTMVATELTQPSAAIGNGTSAHSHKKRQPPLPKPQAVKGRTRTSARQANGRSSAANASSATNISAASTSASATPPANSPSRPKRATAQKGRGSWAQADADPSEYEDEEPNYPPAEDVPMDVDDKVVQWRVPAKQNFNSAGAGAGAGAGRGGIMKGFGPGAYGKVGGLALGSPGSLTRSGSGSPGAQVPRSRSWGFPPEPPRNTGRTIYSDRKDEEARKAAVDAEEQLRYKRARQKLEQELMTQDAPDALPHPPGWTPDEQ